MAVIMLVTNITIPRTQKRPWHLVKSTYKGNSFVNRRMAAQIDRRTHSHTPYLCLEAENCDGDADNSCDTQSEKHCFCVIVTKKENQQSLVRETSWVFNTNCSSLLLPGNGSSHVGQSQSLSTKKCNGGLQNSGQNFTSPDIKSDMCTELIKHTKKTQPGESFNV